MTASDTHPLGIDLGSYGLKLFDTSGGSLQVSQISIPGSFQVGSMLGMKAGTAPRRIELTNGSRFFTGPAAHDAGRPIENLDMECFNGTPEMMALFYSAMSQHIEQYGPFKMPLALTAGLPLQTLTRDVMDSTVENVQNWLKGVHTWKIDGLECQVTVRSVKVTAQPVGGLFDFLLDETGHWIGSRRAAYEGEIGVITIGWNTMEIQATRQKKGVQRFTLGSTVGVRRLLEIADGQRLYTLGEMDNLLRAGKLDISTALPVWERELMGEIERTWGSAWKRFSCVLIMGGGALLLRNSLPYRFGDKALIPSDPIFAVASGLWKLGLYHQRRG